MIKWGLFKRNGEPASFIRTNIGLSATDAVHIMCHVGKDDLDGLDQVWSRARTEEAIRDVLEWRGKGVLESVWTTGMYVKDIEPVEAWARACVRGAWPELAPWIKED